MKKFLATSIICSLLLGTFNVDTALATNTGHLEDTDVYEIIGTQKSESGWYSGDVTIKAKENYILSYDKCNWSEELGDIPDGENIITIFAKCTQCGQLYNSVSDGIELTINKDSATNLAEIEVLNPSEDDKYNSDIMVEISAQDDFSGVAAINYWVTTDPDYTCVTQEQTIEVSGLAATQQIAIAAEDNNSDYVTLHTTYTDVAGNVSEEQTRSFRIDNVRPQISVSYDNNSCISQLDGRGYYDSKRTATVTITERTSSFDSEAATAGIHISAKNASGDEFPINLSNLEWQTTNGETPDQDTHTAQIELNEQGSYSVDFSYTDLFGNSNDGVSYGESVTPQNFVLCWTKPTGNIAVGDIGSWNNLSSQVDYSNCVSTEQYVSINAESRLDGIKNIQYYVSDSNTSLSEDELNNIASWTDGNSLVHSSEGGFVVYAKLVNNSGKITYISSGGIIIDNSAPDIDVGMPAAENGIYNDDVNVDVTVVDTNHGNRMSGIKKIEYCVYCQGNVAQAGTLYETSEIGAVDYSGTLTVNKILNTDSHMRVEIIATDFAGNTSTSAREFSIDTVQPTIDVSGVTNNGVHGDSSNIGLNVNITDKNFSEFTYKLIGVKLVNGKFETITIEGVTTDIENGKNFFIDNLTEDGVYTLTATAVDKAGNVTDIDPIHFSINREGSNFELNDYAIEVINNYYVHSIYDDISIIEYNTSSLHNYTVSVNNEQLEEGKDYNVEVVEDNEWFKYIYTLNKKVFEDEGLYSVVVNSMDSSNSVAYSDIKNMELSFVVDQTAPIISVSGIEDDSICKTDLQTASVFVSDDGGKVKSLCIEVLDKNNELIKDGTRFDMSGDDLTEYLSENNNVVSFTIPEGENLTVRIECADCSVMANGKTNVTYKEVSNITVSSVITSITKKSSKLWNLKYLICAAGISVILISLLAILFAKKNTILKSLAK